MRRLLAASSVLFSIAAFACSSAPPEEEEVVVESPLQWSAAQCKNIHQGYIGCLQGTNEAYRTCVQDAQTELVNGMIGDLAGLTTGAIPCVSASLTALLDSRCIFTSGDAAGLLTCVSTGALAVLGHLDQFATFNKCATEIGAKPEALTSYTRGFEKSLAAVLAIEAARVTRYVKSYELCANELESSADACEPIACNQAKCTCFDTPSCPTIARCGGSTTHMTGIVDCGSISNGKATTNQGNSISCVSYTNQASAGCHGKATAGACK